MNYYPNYNQGYNQYYGQNSQVQMPRVQPMEQQYLQQYTAPQPIYKPTGLQGKSVDNIEVVKATDIPLDGTISYFPLTDGTAIVTKQLMPDGSSRTMVYKPIEEEKAEEMPRFVTENELNEKINIINNDELKEDIKTIKKEIESITDDIKKIHTNISKRKD